MYTDLILNGIETEYPDACLKIYNDSGDCEYNLAVSKFCAPKPTGPYTCEELLDCAKKMIQEFKKNPIIIQQYQEYQEHEEYLEYLYTLMQ